MLTIFFNREHSVIGVGHLYSRIAAFDQSQRSAEKPGGGGGGRGGEPISSWVGVLNSPPPKQDTFSPGGALAG